MSVPTFTAQVLLIRPASFGFNPESAASNGFVRADAVLCEALGPLLTAQFVELKRAEYDAHARHVSDWELRRYAAKF